jgi:hypothetical protein
VFISVNPMNRSQSTGYLFSFSYFLSRYFCPQAPSPENGGPRTKNTAARISGWLPTLLFVLVTVSTAHKAACGKKALFSVT